MTSWMVGIDTGGTFNDLIAFNTETQEFRVAKVPSNPDDPAVAVIAALEEFFESGVRPGEISFLAHGTTFATNALLEGRGVKAGLLITEGFRAVYGARGWVRPNGTDLVDPFYQKPPLLVPQSLTEEIPERVDFAGESLTPLDEQAVRQAVRRLKAEGVEAIAVCYLFSFANPAHEERTAAIIAEEAPDVRVSLSSRVLPVIREYPRLSTTVIDAYVGPRMERYLTRLADSLKQRGVATPQVYLMQSNGGLMRITLGARFPNETLLSGPSAGVVAATEFGRLLGLDEIITFDMGGTSADISVISEGRVAHTSEGNIAGQDIGTPMLEIRTLGAGGGTVAWIGPDGLLKVGPHSAGAYPGPACYGRGGTEPTVTDANLILGALGASSVLGGRMTLDAALAEEAVRRVAAPLGLEVLEAAAGIIRIVNNAMAIALRLALQEKGHDPRRFTLVAFGGAGPLHAPLLARTLGIPRVLIPRHPGITSASGLLQTMVRHTYVQSHIARLDTLAAERMNEVFAQLESRAREDAREEGFAPEAMLMQRQIDFRYLHQGYQLPVNCPDRPLRDQDKSALRAAFDEQHERLYGQSAANEDVEAVTFRVTAEFSVPRLTHPEIEAGGTEPRPEAYMGARRLYELERGDYVEAMGYARRELRAGNRIEGPALVEEFDSSTLICTGQFLTIDRYGNMIVETGAGA